MVRCCSVVGCGKKGVKDGVTLFSLPPKDPEKSEWIKFLQKANTGRDWNETTQKYVCSNHFHSAQLTRVGKRKDFMWVAGSVPSFVENQMCYAANTITFELNAMQVPTASKSKVTEKKFAHKNIQVDSTKSINRKKDRTIRDLRATIAKQQRIIARKTNTIKLYRVKLNKYMRRDARGVKRKSKEDLPGHTFKRPCVDIPSDTLGEKLLKELLNRMEKRKNEKYSEDLREFAFELNYFSPRSYEKLRDKIPTFPHQRTFRKWTEHVDTSPGFLQPAIDFIKKRIEESPHPLYFALSHDECHIRKQTVACNGGFVGFVDHAEFREEPSTEKVDDRKGKDDEEDVEEHQDEKQKRPTPPPPKEATTALFCMANEINGSHKIPLMYILTNGLHNSLMKRVILKTVDKIAELGARVVSVTFDGLPANLAAVGSLGANMNVTSPSLQPYFKDSYGNRIHVILDASHMIKLTRNLLKEYGTLENSQGGLIKWDYVVKLQALQTAEGLRAANKLSVQHTNYDNNKMKTKLAAQTLSGSTSVALRFARELGLVGFEDSEATEEFLAIMNRLFDYLNSIPSGKGNRAPLRYSSFQPVSNFFLTCKSYLLGLKKVDPLCKVEPVPLLQTPRKTAVKGLLITMTSIINIMSDHLSDPSSSLKYLPTFKVSQDPLENFFSLVCSRLGFNNNPNVLQLRYALRGIVCMNTKAINSGNCVDQEELSTLISSLGSLKAVVEAPDEQKRILEKIEDEPIQFADLNSFSSNIVMYIAGFVAKRLVQKLQCPSCVYKLYACEADVPLIGTDSKLLLLKDNGGLFLTSFAVFSVCKIAETIIRSKKERLHELNQDVLQEAVIRESEKQGLDFSLACGVADDSDDHTKELIRQLVRKYWSVRSLHLAREKTHAIKPTTNRQKFNKLVLFRGE